MGTLGCSYIKGECEGSLVFCDLISGYLIWFKWNIVLAMLGI